MQNKRSRKNGTATTADGPAIVDLPTGRRVRVRRRLVIGVAVAGLAVLGAGAPAVISASADLNESQQLVTRAEQVRHTLTLAHALADERDAVTEFIARGRPAAGKAALKERAERVDRETAEAQTDADEELAVALGRIETVRAAALTGKGSALAANQAYSAVVAELLVPAAELAEDTPPRATAALATTRPMAPLGLASDQASATRGLLLAALAVPRGEQPSSSVSGSAAAASPVEDELASAAQRARVREQGALDDFDRAARPDVRETLAATVTGPEVKAAEDYLNKLTDRPTLAPADRKVNAEAVGTALSARLDRIRSVESTLATERVTALAGLRDDDVTALEVLVALLGVLFLIAVGVSTAVARSLTRPLSVLRRGAARLATAEGSIEPVRFTGRNDEFAEVVRSLNSVREMTVTLHTKIAGMDADRRRLIGRNEALTAGRTELEEQLTELRAGLEEHRRIMITTSVSLSLRTLGLVERQLTVIEELESKEQDPDRLATLFKLDHLATVMRRHNENLLVLAGQEHGHGQAGPVPLVDVMRAAVSEIERYERVDLQSLPSYTQVAGHAADDISHVLAELLENATTFSPPDAKVKVSGRLLDSGAVLLSVVDEGIGITGDRLELLNQRLSTPDAYEAESESEHGLGLGLYVAGRLAAAHGVEAELRASRNGGTEALVVIPASLLPKGSPSAPVHTLSAPGAPLLQLPGVVAEANENTLPPRLRPQRSGDDADAGSGVGADADADVRAGAVPAEGVTGGAAEAESADEDFHLAPAAAEPMESAAPVEPAGPVADEAEDDFHLAPAGARTADADADVDAGADPGTPAAAAAVPEVNFPEDAGTEGGLPPVEQVFTVSTLQEQARQEQIRREQAAAEPERAESERAESERAESELAEPGIADLAPEPAPEQAAPAPDYVLPEPPVADPGAVLPPVSQVFHVDAPEMDLPPQGQVFTVPAPEPEAAPAPGTAPEAGEQLPPQGQVFTVPAPQQREHQQQPQAPLPQRRRPQPDPQDGRQPGPSHAPVPAQPAGPEGPEGPEGPVTDKGLPKRTPRVVTTPRTAEPRPEPKKVDAADLRRRLGGFYQGALDGRRVVAAELAEGRDDQGDTAQEART